MYAKDKLEEKTVNTQIVLLAGSGAVLINFAPHLTSVAAIVTYTALGLIGMALISDIVAFVRGRNGL